MHSVGTAMTRVKTISVEPTDVYTMICCEPESSLAPEPGSSSLAGKAGGGDNNYANYSAYREEMSQKCYNHLCAAMNSFFMVISFSMEFYDNTIQCT